jgi:WASH complex subunit 7
MDDQWAADTTDDHLQRPLIEQTKKLNKFVLDHETILREIEQAIGNAIAETPTSHYKPIRTVTEPVERIFPQDLIITDNDILHKVLTVIIFLCDEINELNHICEDKFIPPLIMFGQFPATSDADAGEDNDAEGDMSLANGKKEKMLGQLLPLLQELSNFVDRCYSVSVNFVQQISSLLNEKEELYKSSFQKTHLTKVFNCLGSLFKTLISLDCIIDQNEILKESWTSYKYMIAIARSDTTAFSTTDQELANFEKLLVSLDSNIMTNEIFKGCIEQNFEVYLNVNNNYSEEFIRVRENTTFLRELLSVHKTLIEQSLEIMNRTNEMNEREDIIHAYALYALYRQLVNLTTPPDPKIQKYLWGLQKQVPVIIMHDKVVWYTGEFLTNFAPFHLKKPDPPSSELCRKQYLQAFDNSLSQRVANLTSQAQNWLILAENRIQSSLKHEESVAKAMDLRGSIVLKGMEANNQPTNTIE